MADQDDPGHATYTALSCSVSLGSRSMRDYGPFETNVEYSYNIGVVYKDNPNETYWYNSPGAGTGIGVGIVRRSHGVWISPTNLTIDEGGASKFYEVRLNTAPSSNVTVRMAEDGDVTLSHSSLTFTPSNWERKQTVTVNSVQDADAADDFVTVEHTVTAEDNNYNGVSAPDVTVTINDDETAKVIISPTELTVTEGRSSSYNVRLDTEPSDDVTVSMSPNNDKLSAPTSTTSLTFTPSNYGNQRVTVTGAQDVDADNDTTTISHTVSGATEYSGIGADAVTVSIRDDEVPVIVSYGSEMYTVKEGDRRAITVRLDKDPRRTVIIPIQRSNTGATDQDDPDPDYSGVPDSVTFNSGQTTRIFNFSAADDSDDDDNESVLLSFGTLPLHVSEGSVSTTAVGIADDDYPLINVSFVSPDYTVGEGATTTIEFELTGQPQRRIAIPLRRTNQGATSGDYFVPSSVVFESDETRKSIIFEAWDDTIDDDDESVILSFSSSLPDNVDVDAPDAATVSITDNDDPPVTVRFDQSSYTVAEDGSVEVKVLLNRDPEREVEIPIIKTNRGDASDSDYSGVPNSVTLYSGDTSTSIIFSPDDDAEDDDGESVRLSFGTPLPDRVTSASPSATTINIADNDDPEVRVSFEQDTYTVAEGRSVSIKITLDGQPERALNISIEALNQGLTTAADYSAPDSVAFTSTQTEKTITFSATQDSIDDDGESVILQFSVSNLNRVELGTYGSATVLITDDDGRGVTLSRTTLGMNEGRTSSYTVKLDTQTTADVTVNISSDNTDDAFDLGTTTLVFSTSTWNSAQRVNVEALEDPDAENESVTISHDLSSSDSMYATLPTESLKVIVSIDDNETAGVTFDPREQNVSEDDTPTAVTYTVALNTPPSDDVNAEVEIVNPDDDAITLFGETLTFTPTDYEETVALTVFDDDDADSETIRLRHTFAGASEYDGISSDTVTISIQDDDTPGVKIAPTQLEVDEDSSDSYDVVLNTPPTRDVAIMISESGDTGDDITLSTTTLTFSTSTWDMVQQVTVTAKDDDDAIDETVTLTHSVSGYGSIRTADSVAVTINDPDVAGVDVTPTNLRADEGSEEWESYDVTLDFRPSGNVRIDISKYGDGDLDVTPSKLTFTPSDWDYRQQVMVKPRDDDDAENATSTISHTVSGAMEYDGIEVEDVDVEIIDDDEIGMTIAPTEIILNEDVSTPMRYTVKLNTRPSDSVFVTMTKSGDSDDDVRLSEDRLTFTTSNWRNNQTVTVSTGQDDDMACEVVTIEHSATSTDSDYNVTGADVTVTVNDDDEPGVTIRPTVLNLDEDGPSEDYIVRLNAQPDADVTIGIQNTDDAVTVSPSALSLTFNSTNWNKEQRVTVTPVQDNDINDESFTIAHTVSGIPTMPLSTPPISLSRST